MDESRNVGNTGAADRLWSKDFVLICVINFFTYLGFQMLLPTLPIFVKHLGGNDATAGLVMGVFAASAVLFRPLVGLALDAFGRKVIFLTGLLLFILTVLAHIWAPTVFFLLLIRFIHGLGWGAAATSSSTVASDIIPKSRIAEGMGYFGLTGALTMALAPALGLWLIGRFGFSLLFATSAAFVTLAAIMALFTDYRPVPAVKAKLAPLEKTAIRPSLVILFVAMTYGSIITFLALYATQQGITNIGPFFTVYALALLASRSLCGRLSDRYGFKIVVIPGIGLVITAMFVIYLAHGLAFFLLAGVLYGIGYGIVQPSLQAMSVMDTPPERRGAANGTFFTGFDLGIGISSVIWGTIVQATGYRVMYLWTLAPALMALILFLAFERGMKRPQPASKADPSAQELSYSPSEP